MPLSLFSFVKVLRKYLFFILAAFSLLLLFIHFANNFLTYTDQPDQVDTIVLFIGPEYGERLREAKLLMQEGYACTLIIPAYNKSYTLENEILKEVKNLKQFNIPKKKFPAYYENTHIEILETIRIMQEAGFTSAIFVSSPYHMRRIKVISSHVFEKQGYQLKFIGSRFNKNKNIFSLRSLSVFENLFMEYGKIFFFYIVKFFIL